MLNSFLFILFFTGNLLFASSTNTLLKPDANETTLTIENFLSTVDYSAEANTAVIFSDFLIKENNDFYRVDFLLTESGEFIILNKELDEEYHIMDSYSSKNLKKYSFAVANISPTIEKA